MIIQRAMNLITTDSPSVLCNATGDLIPDGAHPAVGSIWTLYNLYTPSLYIHIPLTFQSLPVLIDP